ncbi:cytidylyltransferase domain-containing protein [Clostridium algidicarnis]|uniref:CMP-N-acetylneuraminic acid synthetase n=1 Tax=Clostridium algidicarnis DSM 15099 TaxID=1121295 RepID=A0A2S6FVH3_9CLOT|nr:acylneuraminate cytidylyltransferase [Clostridium algidicarnis]PPK46362.1 CMP-N-acetylneuraminic acid synthetase [Clostridium algidicarnis DSM 15099]
MKKDSNILAVIPARGGSKGIPRKNVRLMNGKPLISYSIENAKSCNLITDIVVTTDDEEIIGIAKLNKIDFIQREAELAGDKVTLDPVVYDAVIKMEQLKNKKYDIVVTLQATSPLLKGETLKTAIESFLNSRKDTYISAVNKPHLSWSKDESGYIPNYEKRLNRQQLPPNYVEAGAFFITKREFVTPNSRMGKEISVFEVPENESVDIDSTSDWIICENALRKKRIVFRADGYKELGMGHIYHCLTLAYNMTGHEVMFASKGQYAEGVDKIKGSFMPFTLIRDDNDFFDFLKVWKPDIVVNDCLDTSKEYIQKLKSLVKRVVTIEDLGEGAEYADAVINALYDKKIKSYNQYSGEKYICLRDEFLVNTPKEFSKEVNNVLVMFGGTDPSNLTKKIYNLALKLSEIYPNITFNFITGSGYDSEKNGIYTQKNRNIYVHNDVKHVSDYMRNADLAFTSQGRTVFELASLGVPSIVLAQNEREQLHKFAQMQNGFLNLGLGKDISAETIESTFKWLVETEQIRYELRELMLRHNLKKGIKHVIDIILEEN